MYQEVAHASREIKKSLKRRGMLATIGEGRSRPRFCTQLAEALCVRLSESCSVFFYEALADVSGA